MKDLVVSEDKKERIISWLFILVMRLYGQNIYSDDSYIWKVLDLETVEDIDAFFENVLIDFKRKHQDISSLIKKQQRIEDILSR